MALPSLRDILALPAFAGAEVLAGQSRLDEPVTWVHVSELMDACSVVTARISEVAVVRLLAISRMLPSMLRRVSMIP